MAKEDRGPEQDREAFGQDPRFRFRRGIRQVGQATEGCVVDGIGPLCRLQLRPEGIRSLGDAIQGPPDVERNDVSRPLPDAFSGASR